MIAGDLKDPRPEFSFYRVRLSHFATDLKTLYSDWPEPPFEAHPGFHKAAIDGVRVDDNGNVRLIYKIFRAQGRRTVGLCLARSGEGWETLYERSLSEMGRPQAEFLRERACFFGCEANWPGPNVPQPLANPADHIRLSSCNAYYDFAGVDTRGDTDTPSISGFRALRIGRDGSVKRLGTLGGIWSFGRGVNNRGDVVGVSENSDGLLSTFYWSEAEGMKPLPIDAIPTGRAWDGYPISLDHLGNVVMGYKKLHYIRAPRTGRAHADILVGPDAWTHHLSLSPNGRYLALVNVGVRLIELVES